MKGESLLYNNWIDCNLIYINHLLDEKGKLSEELICKDINIFTNKLFYSSKIKAKAANPVGFSNWSRHFLDEKPDMSQIYSLIFYFCKKINLKFSVGNLFSLLFQPNKY